MRTEVNDRIAQMSREAGLIEARDVWEALPKAYTDALLTLAHLVAEDFVEFVQSYPHWLGPEAKREMIEAIRSRYK